MTYQLQLWAKENERFTFRDAVLYSNFDGHEDFEVARQYAADLHALLWSDAKARKFCVTDAGNAQLTEFLRARKKQRKG